IPEDIAQHLLHVCAQALYQRGKFFCFRGHPATLTEPKTISVQHSFYRILHSSAASSSNIHASIRHSKFPFSSTPSMFMALGPRDLDSLNSQEIIRLAVYVIKQSAVEMADPVLCEKIHTEGEKKFIEATPSKNTSGLKQSESFNSNNGNNTKGSTRASGSNNNIPASSIYLTREFNIGDSVLHHRTRRPSKSLESVLSIATFCARASQPSPSQVRRASIVSSSGSDNRSGNKGNKPSAAMVGARWIAKLGQEVFGGPCAQAGHSHHRRTKTRLSVNYPSIQSGRHGDNNAINDSLSTSAQGKGTKQAQSRERLCKYCSGAMACLSMSIIREGSSSISPKALVSSIVGGSGKGTKDAKSSLTDVRVPAVNDSGFESSTSGFALLDTQSDDITSDTSSSSSLSPSIVSSSMLPGSPRVQHGQTSYASIGSPIINDDYRPRLKLKHRSDSTWSTPNEVHSMGSLSDPLSSPLAGERSNSLIVFDKSHQRNASVHHPESESDDDNYEQQHAQPQQYGKTKKENETGDIPGVWSPSHSALSESIIQAFGSEVEKRGGDYKSNMHAVSSPQLVDSDTEEDIKHGVAMGKRTATRLEQDLADALNTPVVATPSSPSAPIPIQVTPPPPHQSPTTLAPSTLAIRRMSVTGLGISASDDSDDEDVFHQANDHFIHPPAVLPDPLFTVVSPILPVDDTRKPILQSYSSQEEDQKSKEEGRKLEQGEEFSAVEETSKEVKEEEEVETERKKDGLDFVKDTMKDNAESTGHPKEADIIEYIEDDNTELNGHLEEADIVENVDDDDKKSNDQLKESRVDKYVEDNNAKPSGHLEEADIFERVEDDNTKLTSHSGEPEIVEYVEDDNIRPSKHLEEAVDFERIDDITKPTDQLEEKELDKHVEDDNTDKIHLERKNTDIVDTDDVETDEESQHRATVVIEKLEDDSVTAAVAKDQIATAKRYSAVGLHGKTPADEYAYEIEELIQRGAHTPPAVVQDREEQEYEVPVKLPSPVNSSASSLSQNSSTVKDNSDDHEVTKSNHTSRRLEEINSKNSERKASEATVEHTGSNTSTPDIASTRSLSTVSSMDNTTSIEATAASDSSFDYEDHLDPDLDLVDHLDDDMDDSNHSDDDHDEEDLALSSPLSSTIDSPTATHSISATPAIQKESNTVRNRTQQRRRRRRIQLVDDAQRKKLQLDRIQAQLERKILGKIREQVSFWERKGVLEQEVVGAEVLEDDEEDHGIHNNKALGDHNKEQDLKAEEKQGESLSPGNSKSLGGYGEIPQLALRRSLRTSSSTLKVDHSKGSDSSTSKDMDSFLSNVD
ncbi:hypothetical protein FBU30_007082, partial [Linnemannia zychae]